MVVLWFEPSYEKARICRLAVCEFCRAVWIQYWGKCNRKEQRKQPQEHRHRVWDEEGSANDRVRRATTIGIMPGTRSIEPAHRVGSIALYGTYLPRAHSPYTRVASCIGYLLNCVRLRPRYERPTTVAAFYARDASLSFPHRRGERKK